MLHDLPKAIPLLSVADIPDKLVPHTELGVWPIASLSSAVGDLLPLTSSSIRLNQSEAFERVAMLG